MDLNFSSTTMRETLRQVADFVSERGRRYVCFCEANLYASAVRDAAVAEVLRRADLLLADGIAVYTISALQGQRLPERVPGPSFLLAACEFGLERGWRHFFYGGAAGVAEALAASLTGRFPGLTVAGCHSPPFRPLTAAEEVAEQRLIGAAKPDLLWVGLGGPKQELWMAAHVGRIDVPVMLGIGAAFDFHSGHRPWAPPWVRRAGLEWAFRMLTGGRGTLRRNLRCVAVMALQLGKALAAGGWRRWVVAGGRGSGGSC